MKNNLTLGHIMNKRSNNLQFLRWIAAVLVITGHSFVLCDSTYQEFVYWISGNEITLGRVAVAIFFFASGLLVSKSIENKNTFKDYFKARCIRIFPLLWVVTICTIFVCMLVSREKISDYFSNHVTWKYLLNGILIPQHELPGVFLNNHYDLVVNGSLWTLPVEFVCYIVCFVLYHLGVMQQRVMKYTIPLCIVGMMLGIVSNKVFHNSLIEDSLCLCIIFYVGMLYYVFRDKLKYSISTLTVLFIVFVVTVIINISWIGIICFFPYALSFFFFSERQINKKLSALGDYSYGMYLCAFPIQQLLIHLFGGNMNPYLNIIISIPISFFVSFLLVDGIEKKFLGNSTRS